MTLDGQRWFNFFDNLTQAEGSLRPKSGLPTAQIRCIRSPHKPRQKCSLCSPWTFKRASISSLLVSSLSSINIRTGVALERQDPNRAIELLKAASPVELSLSGPTNLAIFLCPAYLRGEAYLVLRDGSRAATEYRYEDGMNVLTLRIRGK